ncbi:hypothetical protein BCR34DRAFT_487165 [Clohesyomyces aquaticus]|uniref:RanBD1 domain-containing protein n=1 Tax=Clohesyomyces aquaticus TaxID=1231657 RepID=A0A1Y1ZH08_9PLEO|nr:hypothetical protein BCR34DRAFT_487165 [Clohesyomyces aquaticus]
MPLSPTRSDASSESEGRPVREKLKETRIDAQNNSDAAPPSSDQPMSDAPNGAPHPPSQAADQSASGSDSERGRLRRKRSFEDFTVDHGAEKQPEKHERHTRKKSRDITSPSAQTSEVVERLAKDHVDPIEEHQGDESMVSVDETPTSKDPVTPEGDSVDMDEAAVISPKNKRTRDALERDIAHDTTVNEPSKVPKTAAEAEEERNPKRPRDKSDPKPQAEVKEGTPEIPATSRFSNTSAASPFAALSPVKSDPNVSEKKTDGATQTSDDKFKKSGFGSFASSTSSPFGALGSSKSSSPFAAAGQPLKSFASPQRSSAAPQGGFPAPESKPSSSVFGGSLGAPASGGKPVFGGGLANGNVSAFGNAGGFGSLISSKPLGSSFATPGVVGISGLKSQPEKKPFGASGQEEDGDDDDDSNDDSTSEDRENSEQDPRFHQQSVETGEEHEDTAWSGRAKLYTMAGEGESKRWQERGVGPFKFNITKDSPKKARFVLRADGTHRLLLNASVSKKMMFGGDPKGAKPTTGQVYFNAPTVDGKLEMHTIKMRNEKAVELWEMVRTLQEHEL